jgi:hypothetical protein
VVRVADAPAPARRKGFDLRNPGGKEYAVVGVATIGLYFIYEWWKNRNAASTAAAAAATTPATTTTPTYGPGTGSSALWLALHDLQGTNTRNRYGGWDRDRDEHDRDGDDDRGPACRYGDRAGDVRPPRHPGAGENPVRRPASPDQPGEEPGEDVPVHGFDA